MVDPLEPRRRAIAAGVQQQLGRLQTGERPAVLPLRPGEQPHAVGGAVQVVGPGVVQSPGVHPVAPGADQQGHQVPLGQGLGGREGIPGVADAVSGQGLHGGLGPGSVVQVAVLDGGLLIAVDHRFAGLGVDAQDGVAAADQGVAQFQRREIGEPHLGQRAVVGVGQVQLLRHGHIAAL